MKPFLENIDYNAETSLKVEFLNNYSYFAHWHNDIQIVYVYEGSIGIGINREYQILSEGDICICGSNDIHYSNSNGMSSTIFMIMFRPDILCESKFWINNINPCSIFINDNLLKNPNSIMLDSIQSCIKNIINESNDIKELSLQFLNLRICEFFLLVFRYFPSYYKSSINYMSTSSFTANNPMQKAIKYLNENYMENISLDTISKEVNLSSFYFSRAFKKTTGTNFNTYLTHIRINSAEDLIKTTQKHIIEIAYETGFHSIRTFNRSFKNLKGYTPQSLRNK